MNDKLIRQSEQKVRTDGSLRLYNLFILTGKRVYLKALPAQHGLARDDENLQKSLLLKVEVRRCNQEMAGLFIIHL